MKTYLLFYDQKGECFHTFAMSLGDPVPQVGDTIKIVLEDKIISGKVITRLYTYDYRVFETRISLHLSIF